LHELAIEEEKYRRQIAQILCSHIRSKTNEAEYKETHSKRPSNEIQTTIDLLFKEEGLYEQDFARVDRFPEANLSHAYLMGADFVPQNSPPDTVHPQKPHSDTVHPQKPHSDTVHTQKPPPDTVQS
jgi:hypothetical protein